MLKAVGTTGLPDFSETAVTTWFLLGSISFQFLPFLWKTAASPQRDYYYYCDYQPFILY